jgi:hypothetical protein
MRWNCDSGVPICGACSGMIFLLVLPVVKSTVGGHSTKLTWTNQIPLIWIVPILELPISLAV